MFPTTRFPWPIVSFTRATGAPTTMFGLRQVLRRALKFVVAVSVVIVVHFHPADSKVLILHDVHEGSHGSCEAFAHLCVKTDCSERHDANRIHPLMWDEINNSDNELFLTRFKPETGRQDAKNFVNHTVVYLVRENLFDWAIATYFWVNGQLSKGDPEDIIEFQTSALDKAVQERVRPSALKSYHQHASIS